MIGVSKPFPRSIPRHRWIDLVSPGFDAAVEIDGIVEAGIPQEVDDHLAASAMMANHHQRMIGRKFVDPLLDLGHRNVQRAFQPADRQLAGLPDIENAMRATRGSQF